MKFRTLLINFGIVAICLTLLFVFRNPQRPVTVSRPLLKASKASDGTREDPTARKRYQYVLQRNPKTREIPRNIRSRELAFIKESLQKSHAEGRQITSQWLARGPYNVGGRTKALAIDIRDEKTIIAGCVSSGMWRSTDSGASWVKTTAPDQLQSVSCIAQNRHTGLENVWYYGTGEYDGGTGGSAAGPGGTTGFYRGDGIFKSLDGGTTWSVLPATISATPHTTDAFDFIYKIITFSQNSLLVATSCGVFKSSDGGATWSHVLDFGSNYTSSDIAMTTTGTFYATIDGPGAATGVYQSGDGETWVDISPPAWPDTTTRTVIAIAPSNEKKVFFLTEVAHLKQTLYRYEEDSGWTDMTTGLPHNAQMMTYGANMMIFYVKPDDEQVLFLGTVGMYRSMDGGQSFEVIGGGYGFHVDQHAIAFLPSDPSVMIVGNDGGLYRTLNNVAPTIYDSDSGTWRLAWESLNNGYVTTQFYTVAVDHGTSGSELILGGTQDNSWLFTDSTDPLKPWTAIFGGAFDGGYCAISKGGHYFYTGAGGTFAFYRNEFVNGVHKWTEITPASAIGMGLWMNPFLFDAHDDKIMYVPSRRELWRNSDVTAIPEVWPGAPTDVNWTKLENAQTDWSISALGMSEAEPRRLYYGTIGGRIFRLDNPHQGQPVPVEVQGNNLPWYPSAYVHCLAVDPRNIDKLLVVLPNYEILSIFYSEDGGDNWTPVSGNLEEFPNGSGSGPSVRWVTTLYVQDQPVYFAGTSVGLFSTTKLDGMNTVWTQEGAETIGHIVVDMIDVRESDGFVAVASHGNGLYTTHVTELPSGIAVKPSVPQRFTLYPAYPNPFNSSTNLRFTMPAAGPVRLTVHNILGETVAIPFEGTLAAGEHTRVWRAGDVASGTYFVQMSYAGTTQTQKVTLQK